MDKQTIFFFLALGWFTKNKTDIFQWDTPLILFIFVIKLYLQNMKKIEKV